MFWMDAEMDDCDDKANGVLVLKPLVKGEMEEWLAPNPTFAASEDCTNKRETPPLTAAPHFPRRFATASVCHIARASSISTCKRFFNAICSVFLVTMHGIYPHTSWE
jgi:hypothetical protein